MKTRSVVLLAILALASYTAIYIGLGASNPEPAIPALSVFSARQDSISGQSERQAKSSIGEVVFPHLEHIEDFEIECQECHHEVNAAALDIPHEEYFEDFWIDCETCHRKDTETKGGAMACSDCHHEHRSGVADQTLSSKVVIHKNCWECHEVGTGPDASSECTLCHSGEKTPYGPLNSSP